MDGAQKVGGGSPRPARRGMQELRVGAVVALILVILMAGIFLLGSRAALFSRKVEYTLKFPGITNLNEQAPVKLGGVAVGRVTAIRFPEDPAERHILVTIAIQRDVAGRIRRDTEASAKNLSLLSGEKYIELSLGNSAERLAPGSEIPTSASFSIESIAGAGEAVGDRLATTLEQLGLLLTRINEGRGLAGKVLSDREFAAQVIERLQAASTSLQNILQGVEEGRGMAGTLLSDEAYGREVSGNLRSSLQRLNLLLARLESGDSVAGAFLADDAGGGEILADLREASAALRDFTRGLQTGEGLLPRLIEDRESAAAILDNLQSSSASLASILRKIDQEEGTVGKLIADPSVYEGVKNVVRGVNENRILRWYIGRQAHKGAELRGAEEADGGGEAGSAEKAGEAQAEGGGGR